MTKSYQDYKIHVDLVDFQRFVDRYLDCYRDYRQKTSGHPRVLVSYEELCRDPVEAMKPIWRLLGLSEPDGAPTGLKECVQQSAGALAPLRDSISNYDELEFACRHDPELNRFLDLKKEGSVADSTLVEEEMPVAQDTPGPNVKNNQHKWALLIPIRASPDETVQDCRQRLQSMYEAIQQTTAPHEKLPLLLFGVDDDDPIYTDTTLLTQVCGSDTVVKVFAGLQGRICRIWKRLAAIAYDEYDVDFTLLLGDDVVLLDRGWRTMVEEQFTSIATNQRLPFGAACVALLDESFPGFPTFPVIHKWHYQTFEQTMLPSQFDNQGGDPYLFEVYRRLGASQFALNCRLQNTIGGKHQARYTKQRLRFEDDILTTSINVLERALPKNTMKTCVDIVVPCYRCDMAILQNIIALRASWPIQLSFWIVLDNPHHVDSDKVRTLQNVRQNYQVNVLEQFDSRGNPRNYGASAARNYGLAHSKADYCVLIDDDCIPSESLLDAYVGAILRSPNASVLVGLTHFPPPHNLLTHAIVASDIPGAYSIATRTREPPWGVTANLCVKARQSRLRFDLSFPRAGGGEDLDYCARARRHGVVKSVPGAVAHHPWWSNGDVSAIRHILAWAEGEVLCLGKQHMREHVFWTMPNGVETMICSSSILILLRCCGVFQVPVARFVLAMGVLFVLEVAWKVSGIGPHRLRNPISESASLSLLVRCSAALLILSQDLVRMLQAVDHSPFWMFWRVDWHFGQMPHLVAARKRNNAVRCVLYVSFLIYFSCA